MYFLYIRNSYRVLVVAIKIVTTSGLVDLGTRLKSLDFDIVQAVCFDKTLSPRSLYYLRAQDEGYHFNQNKR